MHQAPSAHKSRHSATSTSRFSKYVAAGAAAVVGAGAIAITPMVSTPDDVRVEARAVALTAAADPLQLFEAFVAETQLNLALLQLNSANSQEALTEAFSDADLFGEFSNILALNAADPLPLITRLLTFQAVYGDDIDVVFNGREDNPATPANEAYQGVFQRVQQAAEEFGPLLADLLTYDPPAPTTPGGPVQGQFTNAAFEANNFFVLRVLNALRPLSTATPAGIVPLLSIPGDFLGGGIPDPTTANPNPVVGTDGGFETALPGFDRIDNVINVFGEQGAARAIFGPFLTSGFQIAQVLDDVQAAQDAGDTELAANELQNLPIRTLNAFVNGFTPSFSPGEWPSLLSGATLLTGSNTAPGGLQYALVTSVNDLVRALGGTVPQLETELPSTTTQAPSNARSGAALLSGPPAGSVTLNVEPAPKAPAADTAKLVSTTAPTTGDTKVIEGSDVKTPTKTVKKAGTSTWGTKTQDAIKKAGADLDKTVKSIFGRKTESTKAEPTKITTETTSGGDSDGDKSAENSNDTNDSD